MFFHTRNEIESARIFGVTDKYGLRLVNQDHPFPYFVEQEERYHAALISHTTYGGLYRLFDSLLYRENDDNNVSRPSDLDIPTDETNKTYNYCRAIRKKILNNSLEVHEAFAKYIAFAKQVKEIEELPSSLEKMIREDADTYPYLHDLIDILEYPDPSPAINDFQIAAAYIVAKWILNTSELDLLYQQSDIREFKHLFEEHFLGIKSAIDQRAKDALDFLREKRKVLYRTYNQINNGNNSESIESLIYGSNWAYNVFMLLVESLPNHNHSPLEDSTRLAFKCVVVTHRLKIMSRFIHSILYGGHIKITYNACAVTGEIEQFEHNIPAMIGSDLAYRVSYDPRYNQNSRWITVAEASDIFRLIEHKQGEYKQIDDVLAYPCLGANRKLKCYLNVQIALHDYGDDDMHVFSLNCVFSPTTFQDLLDFLTELKPLNTSIIFLPFQNIDLKEYRKIASLLSKYGQICIWTHNADLASLYLPVGRHFLLMGQNFAYESKELALRGKQKFPNNRPLMLVSIDDNFCFFSAAPVYYLDTILSLNRSNPEVQKFTNPLSKVIVYLGSSITDIDTDRIHSLDRQKIKLTDAKQRSAFKSAIKAYQTIYDPGGLPEHLPVYDSEEMLKHIKSIENV